MKNLTLYLLKVTAKEIRQEKKLNIWLGKKGEKLSIGR